MEGGAGGGAGAGAGAGAGVGRVGAAVVVEEVEGGTEEEAGLGRESMTIMRSFSQTW